MANCTIGMQDRRWERKLREWRLAKKPPSKHPIVEALQDFRDWLRAPKRRHRPLSCLNILNEHTVPERKGFPCCCPHCHVDEECMMVGGLLKDSRRFRVCCTVGRWIVVRGLGEALIEGTY